MRVLIAGAGGQLGRQLVAALQEKQWIDLLFVNRQVLDVTNAEHVDAYVKNNNPDLVINAAAFTAVDDAECLVFEANQVNHLGAANLARASANIGAAIIQVSTDYVFSGDANIPYVEGDSASPVNIYGRTKLAGEVAVMRLNPKHLILRTAWLFGGSGKNFYLTIARLLKTKNNIHVVNDQIGAPTYIVDLVAVILSAITKLHNQGELSWGVYHYAGYPYVSWFDFAKAIQVSLYGGGNGGVDGAECEVLAVNTEFYPAVAKRPRYSCLNSSKACDYFEVKPSAWLCALNQLAIKGVYPFDPFDAKKNEHN
jgi:dTDP-4-dehydrorhamnose reductase